MKIFFEEALELLKKGSIVGLPTETVYGLATRYDLKESIEDLYVLKGRPSYKPLTVNLASGEEIFVFLREEVEGLDELMDSFWPGPLTLVVPIKENAILPIVTNNLPFCGFRIPDFEVTRQIIKEVGPIVLPSANISGEKEALSREDIEKAFGENFPVVDGGESKLGVPSTVIIYKEKRWWIVREGVLSPKQLSDVLGYSVLNQGELLCRN